MAQSPYPEGRGEDSLTARRRVQPNRSCSLRCVPRVKPSGLSVSGSTLFTGNMTYAVWAQLKPKTQGNEPHRLEGHTQGTLKGHAY